ncbi:hypothetical protein ADL19_14840 [Streptomyces purpurogeneiscleroticus]|nr:hypothetical protein ADL19_14840 [Streptomyces purpurogeneiscleroticus]
MTSPTPINPLLRAFLPEMIERMEAAKIQVRDLLAPVSIDLAALEDFLAFEVSRTQLELDRAEWSSQADTASIKERGVHLRNIADAVAAGHIAAVTDRMEEILTILKQLEADHD